MTAIVMGTPKSLEANGASAPANTLVQADDATYGIVADGNNYAHAKFVLSCTLPTPAENSVIELVARPINISGTNDAEIPETTRPDVFIQLFRLNNVETTQYIEALAENVPWEAEYYLYVNGTGVTLSAGWTLTVIPVRYT